MLFSFLVSIPLSAMPSYVPRCPKSAIYSVPTASFSSAWATLLSYRAWSAFVLARMSEFSAPSTSTKVVMPVFVPFLHDPQAFFRLLHRRRRCRDPVEGRGQVVVRLPHLELDRRPRLFFQRLHPAARRERFLHPGRGHQAVEEVPLQHCHDGPALCVIAGGPVAVPVHLAHEVQARQVVGARLVTDFSAFSGSAPWTEVRPFRQRPR